jgi:hypothetical protein
MERTSSEPHWPLISLIAVLFMGPSLMVVTFLNLTDTLLGPTGAVAASFLASWALCSLVFRFWTPRSGIKMSQQAHNSG